MLFRGAMRAMAFAALLCAAPSFAFDDAQYPDLSGQWIGLRMPSCQGQPSFDPVKCWGTTQDAPLTPEYQAIFKANIEDQHAGAFAIDLEVSLLTPGMRGSGQGFAVVMGFVPVLSSDLMSFIVRRVSFCFS